jgi:hypothetical protein
LYDLAWVYVYDNPDSTYAIAEIQQKLAQETKNKKWYKENNYSINENL